MFTVSGVLDKPCSQVSSLLPPGINIPSFYRAYVGVSIPAVLVGFHRILPPRAHAFSATEYVYTLMVFIASFSTNAYDVLGYRG